MESLKNKNIQQTRGKFGETAVRDYITARNYSVIADNFRKKGGEIDIIAFDNGTDEIVFIEVKTRKFGSLVDGLSAVTAKKKNALVRTARSFINENPQFCNVNARFDVAEVIVTTDDIPRLIGIEYYANAFDAAFV